MSKEQIEEMEKDLSEVQTIGLVITESQMDSRNSYSREIKNKTVARHLANKGYRKQSELEKLGNKLFSDALETVLFSLVYLGADGKWHTRRNNAEKTTAIVERFLALVSRTRRLLSICFQKAYIKSCKITEQDCLILRKAVSEE